MDVKGGFVKYGDEDDGKVLVVNTNPHFNNFLSILISAAILFKETHFTNINNQFDFKHLLLCGEEGSNIYSSFGHNPH